MRREIEELKAICTSNGAKTKSNFSLQIPRSTAESFLELEEQVKTEDGENALKGILNGLTDISLEKYVRNCLKAVLLDRAACSFSWFGHHGNTPVHALTVMNIIKECTMAKFPNARITDFIAVAKKWFQYAKDGQRKLTVKTNG
ncbi:uncharacterized protein LOC142219826 [Haematobia irritans]|uniref:uncharacterized protein LOC142219826 n=1 Tax=Haematobia irritans TaxID=7368 RepID=UPI003F500BB4